MIPTHDDVWYAGMLEFNLGSAVVAVLDPDLISDLCKVTVSGLLI